MKAIHLKILIAAFAFLACFMLAYGCSTANNSNLNSNANSNANANTNELSNANTNSNTETRASLVEKGDMPAFVVHYSNYAWGFRETVDLVFIDGTTGHWENKGNKSVLDGDVPTQETVDKILADQRNLEAATKLSSNEVEKAWKEAIQANFDAPHSKPQGMANDYGSVNVYVFDSNNQAHWISCSGDDISMLEDDHVSDAAALFQAKI